MSTAAFIAAANAALPELVNADARAIVTSLRDTAARGTQYFGEPVDDAWLAYHRQTLTTWVRQGRRRAQ